MKRFLTLSAALVLIAGITAGCEQKQNTTAGSSSGSSSDTVSSSSSSSASSEIPSSSDASSDTVSIFIKDEKLKQAYEAVRKEFGEFFVAMPAVIAEEQMTELYYVKPEDIEEFVGEMSMANISGDTFIGVKAKPGKAQAVADALEKRKQDVIEEFSTYPVNFMDIKSQAARVVMEGDYVFLVLLGNIEVADGEEASQAMADKEVQRAVDAIHSVFTGGSSSVE